VKHPVLGPVSFECSTLAVDGRQDLAMIVYFPIEHAAALKIGDLIADEARSPCRVPESWLRRGR
jgi:hypothetical protein